MPVTYLASDTGFGGTPPNNMAAPAGCTANTCLIMEVISYDDALGTLSVTGGGTTWTSIPGLAFQGNDPASGRNWTRATFVAFYGTGAGAPWAINTTTGGAYIDAVIDAYDGVDQTNPITVIASVALNNTANPSCGSITPTVDGMARFQLAGHSDAYTLPSGYTTRSLFENSPPRFSTSDKPATSGVATGAVTATGTSSDGWLAVSYILNQASGGGGGGIGPAIAEWDYQRVQRAVFSVAAVRAEILPPIALHRPWETPFNFLQPSPRPARAQMDVQLPAPMVLRKWAPQGIHAIPLPPPRVALRDAQLPAPMVLLKWAPQGPVSSVLPGPKSVAHNHPLPNRMVLYTWGADNFPASAASAPSRVRHDDVQPAPLATIQLLPWSTDGNAQFLAIAPLRSVHDGQFPAVSALPVWGGDGNLARALPVPTRAFSDVQLPAPNVLLGWAADGNPQFSARGPSAASRDAQLPAVNVLSGWATDAMLPRQSAQPLRALHDVQLPGFSAPLLFTWAADGNPTRLLAILARAAHDTQLPAIKVLPPWAAEGNTSKALSAPARSVHDAQLPAVQVLSTWAADGNVVRGLPAPLRAVHDVQPPTPRVQSPWPPEGNAGRALPGPGKVQHDAQLPAIRVMSTWAADGNGGQFLPAPFRVNHTTELKAFPPPLLFTWCADGNVLRPQPAPQRAQHDVQLPKANALYGWAPEAQPSIGVAWPARARGDQPLPAIAGSTSAWAGDWFYPRVIVANSVLPANAVAVGAVVRAVVSDWNFQRGFVGTRAVQVDPVVVRSAVAGMVPDWCFARSACNSIALAPLFAEATAKPIPLVNWIGQWEFQHTPLGVAVAFTAYSAPSDVLISPDWTGRMGAVGTSAAFQGSGRSSHLPMFGGLDFGGQRFSVTIRGPFTGSSKKQK